MQPRRRLAVHAPLPEASPFPIAGDLRSPYPGIVARRGTKSARVETCLITTEYDPREIADICHCSYDLVVKLRRRLRLPYERELVRLQISRLQQDVSDQRGYIAALDRAIGVLNARLDGVNGSAGSSHAGPHIGIADSPVGLFPRVA